MNIHSIIPARGGSKGIRNKNIIDFCGKPLIAWTVEQCLSSKYVSHVWVTSNSQEILDVAEKYGAKTIRRPDDISGDLASSESAWMHAIEVIQKDTEVDLVLAPQVTSPLREVKDIDNAIELFQKEKYDSMFSASMAEDLFFWEESNTGVVGSVNYDYKNRKRRQDFKEQIIENGSFYLFKPQVIRDNSNRLGGNISLFVMDKYKMFQIDNIEDIELSSVIMKGFNLNKV